MAVAGVHAVYLVFGSEHGQDFVNLNWFTFERGGVVGVVVPQVE